MKEQAPIVKLHIDTAEELTDLDEDPVNPTDILAAFKTNFSEFGNGAQHDPAEFLQLCLESIDPNSYKLGSNELIQICEVSPSTSIALFNVTSDTALLEVFVEYGSRPLPTYLFLVVNDDPDDDHYADREAIAKVKPTLSMVVPGTTDCAEYRLYSVINYQYAISNSGHYTVITKDQEGFCYSYTIRPESLMMVVSMW